MCVQTHRNLASVHVFIYVPNTHPANYVSIFFSLKPEWRHSVNYPFLGLSCKVLCSVSGCVNQLSKNFSQLLRIPFSHVIPKLFSSGFIQSRADITHLLHTGSPKYSTAALPPSCGTYQANSIQRMTAPVLFQQTQLTAHHRWFRGPNFLALPQNSWPSTGVIKEPSPEDPAEVSPSKCVGQIQVKKDHPLFVQTIQNSSNLHKVKRSVAWLLRFVNNRYINPQNRLLSPFLKAPELREALRFIIRVDQKHFFDEEIRSLKKKVPVPMASLLSTLIPFFDPFGIIRVDGRLQHSSLPQDTKHPIVLSHDSQLSTMVISDLHKLNLHSSSDSTFHALRAQYHVLHPRTSINRVIRKFSHATNVRVNQRRL